MGYDYEKQGYYYTDPSFQLPVLKEDPNNLLPTMAEERYPRTAAIPEWQRPFIAVLADKLLPIQKGEKRHPKASILLDGPAWGPDSGGVKNLLLQALEDGTGLDIQYMEAGESHIFTWLHTMAHDDTSHRT